MPETPKSSRSSLPSSPATPDFNPSPTSLQSSLTPSVQSLSLGRGRGRPRKQLTEPTLEGFPINGTEDDKQRWFHQKCSEQWRYNILVSDKAAEYRAKENARCKAAYYARKEKKAASAAAGAPPKTSEECVAEDTTDKAKEQSRLRYVTYVKKRYVKYVMNSK